MKGVLTPKACQCTFPMWPDAERYVPGVSLYCGEARRDGSAYCGEHHTLCHSAGTIGEQTAPAVLKTLAGKGL